TLAERIPPLTGAREAPIVARRRSPSYRPCEPERPAVPHSTAPRSAPRSRRRTGRGACRTDADRHGYRRRVEVPVREQRPVRSDREPSPQERVQLWLLETKRPPSRQPPSCAAPSTRCSGG